MIPTPAGASSCAPAELFDCRVDLQADPAGAIAALPRTGGVYLLCDVEGRAVLLACAENLRHAVRRRLSVPLEEKTKRANLAEVTSRVHWRPTFSRFETLLSHWQAARRLYPRGYRKLLAFGACWFLRIDASERTPRFTTVKELREDAAQYIGPMPTRSAADALLHTLEDIFDLCRYHHVLQESPRAEACAYFDMGKCPAPCNGSISLDAYRGMIRASIEFAIGRRAERIAELESRMRQAASNLQFERAASIKESIDRAGNLMGSPAYRHLCEARSASWLVVQRASPAKRNVNDQPIKAFFFGLAGCEQSPPARIGDLESALPEWRVRASGIARPAATEPRPAELTEQIWLLARFLFDEERAPGLFFRADHLPPHAELLEAVYHRFAARPPADGAKSSDSPT